MVAEDAAQAIELATQLLVLSANGPKGVRGLCGIRPACPLHLLVGPRTLIYHVCDPFPDPVAASSSSSATRPSSRCSVPTWL